MYESCTIKNSQKWFLFDTSGRISESGPVPYGFLFIPEPSIMVGLDGTCWYRMVCKVIQDWMVQGGTGLDGTVPGILHNNIQVLNVTC